MSYILEYTICSSAEALNFRVIYTSISQILTEFHDCSQDPCCCSSYFWNVSDGFLIVVVWDCRAKIDNERRLTDKKRAGSKKTERRNKGSWD